MGYKTTEQRTEYRRKWYAEHIEERRKYSREYMARRMKEDEAFRLKAKARSKDYAERNREKLRLKERSPEKRALNKGYRKALRLQIIAAYGGKCVCCGESQIEFLSIDHIEGRGTGADHRRRVGSTIYSHIRREGFPDTYRLLCYNCNCSLGFNGYCPHAL